MHEAPLERQRLVPFRHMLAEIAKKRARIDRAEQRRCLAHRDGSRAERLDGKAEAQELRGARDEPLDVGLIEFDDVRNQQDLPADAGAVERRLETLVDDALVGGVLIDDDEAVAGLRDDVGLVHLGARRAERSVAQFRRRLDHGGFGGRGSDLERGLRRLGETECGPMRRARQGARIDRPRQRAAPIPCSARPAIRRQGAWAKRRERRRPAGRRGASSVARQRLLQRA